MNQRTRRRIFIFGPLLLILAILLWPLSHRKWNISADTDAANEKRRILDEQSVVRSAAPRIIIIVADDLGPADVGLYGSTWVPTPNIDSIGEQGVTFTDATCTTAVCAPSRAGLLTGRYQQRYGFEMQPHTQYAWNMLQYTVFRYFIDTDPMIPINPSPVPSRAAVDDQGMPASEIMLPELLAARGYRTAMVGKWHLGYTPEFSPLERGFESHYGFYEAFSLYAPLDDESIVHTPIDDFSDHHMWNNGREDASAIVSNDVVVDESEYLTFKFADLAANYITENADEPFLLYLPFNAPHTPLQAPREYYDDLSHITNPVRRTYYAMIAALDDAVGTVLDAVDDAGIAEDTMVVFASDNGGVTYLGVTDNGSLAGGKFSTFEGGLAVPMMIRYPGAVPPGTVYDRPVSLMDIFATVEEVARQGAAPAGETPLGEREVDGVDLLPYVLGEREGDPHDVLAWRNWYNGAIRSGPWKLIIQGADAPGTDEDQFFLYNLDEDPNEHVNVAHRYPDVVEELRVLFAEWEEDMIEPAWPPVMHFHMDVWGTRFWFAI